MERLKNSEHGGPLHLIRCMGQLAVMYGNEQLRRFVAMMEDAEDVWGEDDE